MTINVLINGAFGRMGQMTVKAMADHPQLTVVGQTGREYDLEKSIKDSKAQVVVDFTHPDAVYNNALTIIEAGAYPVIGTSGLKQDQIKSLQKKCSTLSRGGIIAPNFSLGAVLMMKHAKEIAKLMPYVEIVEMHHDQKADSPSGTALRTAELIAPYVTTSNEQDKHVTKETIPGARGASHHGVTIHAVRLPGFLAHQEVIFGGLGETLTIRHDSFDRQCFMGGVCFACEKVIELKELIYGLEELL